jgi:hypothetical protein
VVDRPPQPYLARPVAAEAPNLVHLRGRCVADGYAARPAGVSLSEVAFVDLLGKFFCFFKTEVTVSFDTSSTLPVSLVPEPFWAISTICCLTPGL